MNKTQKLWNRVAETTEYLDLQHFSDEQRQALKTSVCSSAEGTSLISEKDLKRFQWSGKVFGPLAPNKETGRKLRQRWISFMDMAPLSFHSATIGIPCIEGGRAAYLVASLMAEAVKQNDADALSNLMRSVSFKARELLCRQYGLELATTDFWASDNGSVALFQVLAALKLESGAKIVSYFDTGRIIPQTLLGSDPASLPENFLPVMDVWKGDRTANTNVGPFHLELVHHLTDHYKSDSELIEETLRLAKEARAQVILIPTITSVGRLLPFREIAFCLKGLDPAPYIILDDCQGFGRIEFKDVCHSAWEVADAIIFTGAKAVGALLGTGGALLCHEKFKARLPSWSHYPLRKKAQRGAFVSPDDEYMNNFNSVAQEICHTPELASLNAALSSYPNVGDCKEILDKLRREIGNVLLPIQQVSLLYSAEREVYFNNTMVGFFLNQGKEKGKELKELLLNPRESGHPLDRFPISLSAIIAADGRQYLRFALSPRAASNESDYSERVIYTLNVLSSVLPKV